MGELTSILMPYKGCYVEAFTKEIPCPKTDNHLRLADLKLVLRFFSSEEDIISLVDEKTYELGFIGVNRRDDSNVADEDSINYLSRGKPAGYTESFDIDWLCKAMEYLADMDPRIKGEAGAPIVNIIRVGSHSFDMSEMQELYQKNKDSVEKNKDIPGWPRYQKGSI